MSTNIFKVQFFILNDLSIKIKIKYLLYYFKESI